MSRRGGLERAAAQIRIFNSLHKPISKYQKQYMKAIKECWRRPIDKMADLETLQKFGLGIAEVDFEGCPQFYFNEDLIRLNDRIEGVGKQIE